MGNRNNQVVAPNQGDQNQLLIQQDQIDVSLLVDQPEVKKVYAIKNPIYLKKETLKLERDSQDKNKYYISFNYDSLVNFDLYINFEVSKNKKMLRLNDYIPSYFPHKNFEGLSIQIKNLTKGENVSFLNKSVFVNLSEFGQLKNNINLSDQLFDVCIEMIPIIPPEDIPKNNKNNSDIVVVTLCNIITEENDEHNQKLKPEIQRLKTQNLWIDLYDIFNCGLDSGECLICCSELSNSIFLPCKHLCTCSNCAHSLRMRNNPCPICKNTIDDLLILETEDEGKKETKKEDDEVLISDEPSSINRPSNNPNSSQSNLIPNSSDENDNFY